MEAFFTMEGVLVVAVCTKKDYMAVALPEYPLADSCWVSSKFVHIYSVTFKHIYARFNCNRLDLVEVRLRVLFLGMCVIFSIISSAFSGYSPHSRPSSFWPEPGNHLH